MTEFHLQSRAELDRELAAIREGMLLLGENVTEQLAHALEAIRMGDASLAAAVIDGDSEINEMRFEIEAACESVIATQQPAAGDLRQVIAAMNVVVDLERMGDHAAGIAKTVELMRDRNPVAVPESLERMATLTQEMLRSALEIYASNDYGRAYNVARMDDRIDAGYRMLSHELLERMLDENRSTTNELYLMFVGHNLERIGDRATNIAERVIFTASGKMQELNPEPGDSRVS